MPDTFELRIVTPEHTVYAAPVTSVVAPGVDGYFGVLAHHAPMLAEIGIGRLRATREDGVENAFAVAGGFLQVQDNVATVLADSAEPADKIDVERAEAAVARAKERLAEHDSQLDVSRAEAALCRALNRLDIASHS